MQEVDIYAGRQQSRCADCGKVGTACCCPADVDDVRKFYRFHETRYSGGVIMLTRSTYPVLKETPSGVWLDVYGQRRFCRIDARKRFACPTEQEALDSYHARKRRQVSILRHQLAAAEAALRLTKDGETAPTMLL